MLSAKKFFIAVSIAAELVQNSGQRYAALQSLCAGSVKNVTIGVEVAVGLLKPIYFTFVSSIFLQIEERSS